jgi:PEP-CTERM motif
MRQIAKFAAAASLFALSATGASAAPIIYGVNLAVGAFGTVTGTVTTDGTIGSLVGTNFTAYNLVIAGRDSLGNTVSESLTNLNSAIYSGSNFTSGIVGTMTGMIATPTQITFDFGNPNSSFFLIQKVFGSGTSFFCAATTNATLNANLCEPGYGLVPFNPAGGFGTPFFAGQGNSTPGGPVQQGVTLFATTVPEPATWLSMIAGFGMVGFGMRRKSQVLTTARIAFAK